MTQEDSKDTLTHVVYGLHAASFFLGVTGFVAVILNYANRSDVKGTWLDSHFKWQIRTFWWSLLWGAAGLVVFLGGFYWSVFGMQWLLLSVGIVVLVATAIWYFYRIIKGWIRLSDGREMYVK